MIDGELNVHVVQLYMWGRLRQIILEKHDFYLEQVKARVLSRFDDIEGEAEKFVQTTYEQLGSRPGDMDTDISQLAEAAHEMGLERYILLYGLKKHMILGSLAGLYHQWDKELRDFVEHELRHHASLEEATKAAWKPEPAIKVLDGFDWDYRSLSFFPKIDASRLVVNVYKHGKGTSLDQLVERYPQYLDSDFYGEARGVLKPHVDHEWVSLSEGQLDELAGGLREFWLEMPKRVLRRAG